MYRNEAIGKEDEDFDSMWSRYTSRERKKGKKTSPVTPNYWEAQPEFATLVSAHIPTRPTRRRSYFGPNSFTGYDAKECDRQELHIGEDPWSRLTVSKPPAKLYGDNGIYRFTTPERAKRNLEIVGRSIHAETFRMSLGSYQQIVDKERSPGISDMWRETFDRIIAKDLEFLAETTLQWERLLMDIERRYGINWGLSRLVWAA